MLKPPTNSQPVKREYSSISTPEDVHPQKVKRSLIANTSVILFSALLLFWSVRLIQSQLETVISIDSVLNGTLIDLKAPQEGVISEVRSKTGSPVKMGEPLFVLQNQRVSELQVQAIANRLSQQETELKQVRLRLSQQLNLMQKVAQDAIRQQQLEILENEKNQSQLLSEQEAANARYQLAKLNYERAQALRLKGAIPEASLDSAKIELKVRESEVTGLQARLASLKVDQDAARSGLSLSRTRSNYDPGIRLEELQLQTVEEQQQIQTLQKMIQGTKAELNQAKKDFERKQAVTIQTPTSGVMWRVAAQRGQYVQQGEFLGQLADCNQRWVDAWVDEKQVQSLQIGTPAEIRLNGAETNVTLTGKIVVIRSGIGRLAPGEDTVVAITPNLPRHTQVRVALDADSTNSSAISLNGNLCYIGYTGRVIFKLRKNPLAHFWL